MIPAKAKESYWGVVRDCLRTFHGLSNEEARRRCEQLRKEAESRPRGLARNIFYHTEAFNVACDIAGRDLNLMDHIEEYKRILDHNHGISPPLSKDHRPAGKQRPRRKAL